MNAAPQPIRVYYKTRDPFCLSRDQMFAGPFTPEDFGAVAVVDGEAGRLISSEMIFARMNDEERPGWQSIRSLSTGDVVEIGGVMHQCLMLGWRKVPLDSANTLRARFGISPLPDQPQVLTAAIQRAAGLLDTAQEALSETVDHPRAVPYVARQWVNAALAVLAPHRGDSEPHPQPIRYTLRDGSEESDRTQEVLIFLSEHVEIVIPLPGQTPGVMDPDHELAVTRVELLDGAVRAMLWDQETVQGAGDALVVTIVPACVSVTSLPEG
jgi:hypothetical protein